MMERKQQQDTINESGDNDGSMDTNERLGLRRRHAALPNASQTQAVASVVAVTPTGLKHQDYRQQEGERLSVSFLPHSEFSHSHHQQVQQQQPSQSSSSQSQSQSQIETINLYTYSTDTLTGQFLTYITSILPLTSTRSGSALPGFLSLLLLTMANYMLSPMRDATALAVGVSHIPILTLASTVLALASSVPMGWLFEAPDPMRKGKRWRDRIGLTRGETQGTSLALFLRCFAVCLVGYALSFKVLEWFDWNLNDDDDDDDETRNGDTGRGGGGGITDEFAYIQGEGLWTYLIRVTPNLLQKFGFAFYVIFFLVVHLMKLHSLSLIWGVTSEAMEYEEQAENRERRRRMKEFQDRQQQQQQQHSFGHDRNGNGINNDDIQEEDETPNNGKQSRVRLKRLAFVGFGGTLGGIIGSVFVSMTAHTLRLSGLLIVAAILLLLSAELSVELGQIMLRHWEEEQKIEDDLLSLSQDSSRSSFTSTATSTATDHRPLAGGETMSSSTTTTTTAANHDFFHQNSNGSISSSSNNNGGGSGSNSSMRHVSSTNALSRVVSGGEIDTCMKKVSSYGSMKRVASNGSMKRVASNGSMKRTASVNSLGNNNRTVDTCMKRVASNGSMKRIASGNSIASIRRVITSQNNLTAMDDGKGNNSHNNINNTSINTTSENVMIVQNPHISITEDEDLMESADDNTFKQRLLRGITTILRSRLLMTIFTYNALYATTTTLLSFQRAELVANRSSKTSNNNMHSDTAFLARINIISSVAVFALQASGLGAFIASALGQRGTLSLMPMVRMTGVAMLILWHIKADGAPPNLTFFLILDEFTKVINFAIAKPVRESLWRGLSNEARYEAKPIVDTLANRWGSGSAAFLMSLLDRIIIHTEIGEQLEDGTRSLFGFPPLWILCTIAAVWWAFVSADLGYIRHRIDLELKKQQ